MVLACTTPREVHQKPTPRVVTVGLLTGLQGTTEPCGCTSNPLGGLDRVGRRIASLKQAGPFAWVVVGDTFFESATIPDHLQQQEHDKATLIAEVLGGLEPDAMLLGPLDRKSGGGNLSTLLKQNKLPALQPPTSGSGPLRIDRTLRTVGSVKLGLLGAPENARPHADAYIASAQALRAQGATFVIALVPHPAAEADPWVAQLTGIDAAVTAGSDPPVPPKVVGQTLRVEAGDKGQFVGLLRLHHRNDGPWVYDDQGQATRRSLEARIARLEQTLSRLPEGPAQTARAQKLAQLRHSLAQLDPPVPTGNHVTFIREEVPKTTETLPWITTKLAAYNRSLCTTTMAATDTLVCPSAPTPSANYVGNAACATCHPAAMTVWQQTPHAQAWNTLLKAGKECDVGCVGCHSVGFERPGGYCRLRDAAPNANVGCENCHGAGAGHVSAPTDRSRWGTHFTRGNSEAMCRQCHNPEHSDLFNFETYRPQILGPGHGQPLTQAAP